MSYVDSSPSVVLTIFGSFPCLAQNVTVGPLSCSITVATSSSINCVILRPDFALVNANIRVYAGASFSVLQNAFNFTDSGPKMIL